MSRLLLTKCNEVWVFGETISQGMVSEIRKAEAGIRPSATSRRTVRRYKRHARDEDRLRQQLLCQGLVE